MKIMMGLFALNLCTLHAGMAYSCDESLDELEVAEKIISRCYDQGKIISESNESLLKISEQITIDEESDAAGFKTLYFSYKGESVGSQELMLRFDNCWEENDSSSEVYCPSNL